MERSETRDGIDASWQPRIMPLHSRYAFELS
jgi:hypothetical protein